MNNISKYKKKQADLTTYNEDGTFENRPVQEIIAIRKRHFKKGEFFMTHFDLPSLLIEKNYNGTTYKILMYLLTQLDFNNRIKSFRQIDIANATKTNQANVSRALKILEKDKIIIKKDNDYYFSDNFVKGAGDEKENKKKQGK